MSNIVPLGDTSPFDAIRKYRADGSEYWIARELMIMMGYTRWSSFETPIVAAIENLELNNDIVANHFCDLSRKSSGRDASDYELTRYAAYMTALCCDGRKPEVAAAKKYFASKTHEAETSADALKLIKEQNKNLELQIELLKIEKGIIAPARTQAYKVIDLSDIENIESVEAYIRDRIKLNPRSKVYIGNKNGDSKRLMYPNYLEYCQEHDMGFVMVQRFSKVLMQLVYATQQAKLIKRRDRDGCHVVGVEVLV
jgi:hypothetical protein